MAPLVPYFISPEFNFVIALIVGIGFGYALEQAGFSSTRKLVGLFYGYDFTVLKVFFTAGVTAMTGVLVLGHLGLLDLNLIYINPTYVNAAIVGGIIMGAGFIIGGFCPGTSLCAAAVGRIDAFAFIVGSVIGIFIFMEGFGAFEGLYTANFIGAPTMGEMLGMSPEMFGILLTLVAVIAFILTGKLEDKINGRETTISKERKLVYASITVIPVVLIMLIWITPSRKEMLWNEAETAAQSADFEVKTMDIDQLAFELVHHSHEYNIIDVRDTAAFKTTIPSAINVPLWEMDSPAWTSVYKQPYKKNVFVGDFSLNVRKAAALARLLGDKDPIILVGTVPEFREVIFNPVHPAADADKHELDTFRFREDAKIKLIRMEERLKNLRQPVKKVVVKAEGGCA